MIGMVPSTSGTTRAPLYKVAPTTNILVEPSKALKSPFLVKRQSYCRPDTKVMDDLYNEIINIAEPTSSWVIDIQKLMKVGKKMKADWLNFAISNMRREDARDFWKTKCLGWRHYVDSKWAEELLRGKNPLGDKDLFYRESVLYNVSQSHMVLIPVFHDAHWTLYAFNMSAQKLSILDSQSDTTKGVNDPAERHQKTRCNICDALTETMNFAIDFRSWEYKFPKVPRQQNRDDCGFFVFNFLRLWDGHQLVRWFPTESRELRKDFLAYILSCRDNNIDLDVHISSKIENLTGEMMDCTMQKVAREPTAQVAVQNGQDLEASTQRSNEHLCFSNIFRWNREAAAAMSSAIPDFIGTCHCVTSDGDGVLHIAARFKNVNIVRVIFTVHRALAAVLLSAVNNRGDTPLHCAAAGGSVDMVKFILEDMMQDDISTAKFAKFLRAQNLKGETCLHEAVRHGYSDIVAELISKDSFLQNNFDPLITEDLQSRTLVQIVDNEDISPLYLATTLRMIKIVQALTKMPCIQANNYEASCAGPAGKTALHAAVVLLDKGLVEILLEWKAGLTSQVDVLGNTPLHFLASLPSERRKPNSIMQLLYNFLPWFSWCLCCKPGQDLGIAELIMKKDSLSPLYEDSTGSMPIHIAAKHGRLDVVKELLKGCPYCESSRNAIGQTFLHVAVENEKLDIVDYVCGAQKFYSIFCQTKTKFERILNTEDQDGNTALHLAITKASENSIINASEKIFCTLMRNRAVCLNFANNEGHTPLDLAFLSLHPKVISMKGPREWIFFDLLHGGGDFGICSWDSLAGTVVEPDWEKESERVSKSASMLAVCAVLILNVALLAPFNVLKQQDKNKPFNVVAFQTFVVSDSMAFVCSVAATFYCARAGFAMSDGCGRLKNLITGIYALGLAALALIITVGLALFLVLPGGTGFLPVIIAGLLIFSQLVLGFVGSWIKSTYAHLRAICARAGILRLICILLFQRSAIEPVWVVPSGSTSLLWSVGLVVFGFIMAISFT